MNDHLSSTTRAVRAGIGTDAVHGAVVPPLHLSTNFTFAAFDAPRTYDYTRSGNPTRDELGGAIADLEGGAGCLVTSSGMSAIALVTQLLRPEDLLVVPHDCYGGSHRLFTSLARRGAFRLEVIDQTAPDAPNRISRLGPALVWIETPSNPLLRVTDIGAIADACRRADALLAVDNTFLSPALQTPIALGADLVVHSTTKYLNGHSDVVGGAVVARTETHLEALRFWANCLGLTGAPFDSFLTLRGLRTLGPRIRQHEENAAAVVDALRAHPAVERLHYPGCPSHPGHALAKRQQRGFGGIVSVEVAGGKAGARVFVEGLECFSLAESLGGVESLVAHPATMTHAAMSPAALARAGISPGLVRLSIGIESAADLVRDLHSALERVGRVSGQPSRRARLTSPSDAPAIARLPSRTQGRWR